jgi:beta-xylosidase
MYFRIKQSIMRKLALTLSAALWGITALSQAPTANSRPNTFTNPIFAGDYPDPSILVDGDSYYMVHSSFEYYPGLTIWRSTDLITWSPVTSALNRYVGSVWAPDLVKQNGKYYIYFPANNTNYVVVADAIDGEWSDPIDLKVGNIDPGHIADEQGNRYLYFSSGGYVPLSADGLSVTGDYKPSYSGWPIPRHWVIECMCLEGPKLFQRGDHYYLTVAEGGTAGPPTGHMVISARAKSPLGPWENSPYNPIIRTQNNNDKWCSVGHATIFQAKANNWWMVLHGYEKDHYNRGRQTLLAPIEWTKEGWFRVPANFDIAKPYSKPLATSSEKPHTLNDSFRGNSLNAQWKFFGEFNTNRFSLTGAGLEVLGKGNSLAECSPLLCIPSHHSYTAQVEIDIIDDAIGGLVLFYSPNFTSGILASSRSILTNLRGWQFETEKEVIHGHVYLMLKNENDIVSMFYSLDGENWNKVETSLEVSAYHHNVLNNFLSLRIGLVSMGNGKVRFKNFIYNPL